MRVDDQVTVGMSLEILLELEYYKIMMIWVDFLPLVVVAQSLKVISEVRYFLMHVQHQEESVDWEDLIQVVAIQVRLKGIPDSLVDDHLVKSCHLLVDFLYQLE